MPLNQHTIEQIAHDIFKQYYLTFADGPKKNETYSSPIERIAQGVMHATRVALLVPVIASIYKKGNHPEKDSLTGQNLRLLQVVALFHDVMRGANRDSGVEGGEASARACQEYLKQFKDIDSKTADAFSQLIITKAQGGLFGRILHSADLIDLMRCERDFCLDSTPLYQDHRNNNAVLDEDIIPLVFRMRELIAKQYDLGDDCGIWLKDGMLGERHSKTRDTNQPELKAFYERPDKWFSIIESEFKSALSWQRDFSEIKRPKAKRVSSEELQHYSRLVEKMTQVVADKDSKFYCFEDEKDAHAFFNIVKPLIEEKHSAEMASCKVERVTEDGKLFFRFQISSGSIHSISEALWTARFPNESYIVYKSLRFDHRYFYPDFLQDTIKTKNSTFKQTIRFGPKQKVVVRPNLNNPKVPAVVKRSEKEPMYPREQKEGASAIQSFSIASQTIYPPVFGHDTKRDLVCIFSPTDRDNRRLIWENRLLKYDRGTVNRLFDFRTLKEAQAFYKRKRNIFIFDSLEEFLKHLSEREYNEVLARMRLDTSAQFAIAKDTLSSRLIAKHYAKLAKEKLAEHYQQLKQPWDDRFEFPVFYYLPGDAKHFAEYTDAQYEKDLQAARAQLRDKTSFQDCMDHQLYPLLLAETDLGQLKQYLDSIHSVWIRDEIYLIPLWLKLLNEGYVQILEYAEKTELISSKYKLASGVDAVQHGLKYFSSKILNTSSHYGIKIDFSWVKENNFDLSRLSDLVFYALRWRNSAHFADLVRLGMNVDSYDEDGNTALYSAAEKNQLHFVEVLIKNNACIEQGHELTHETPICIAARNGYYNIVERLIQAGAVVNPGRLDYYRIIPLNIAAENGHLNIVKLLEKKVSLDQARIDDGATPLYVAAENGHFDIVKYLVEKGADVSQGLTNTGATPLYIAAENGHADIVEYLIKNGAQVNQGLPRSDVTSLHIAVKNGHLDVVKCLIANGADPNRVRSDNGATPIYIAAETGDLRMVQYLISRRVEINHDLFGKSVNPLYIAALRGHADIVKYLLKNGADINLVTNAHDMTLLHIAAQNGDLKVVQCLLEHGADVSKMTRFKETALAIATQKGHQPIIQYLQQHANLRNIKHRWTPVFFKKDSWWVSSTNDPHFTIKGKTFLGEFIRYGYKAAALNLLVKKPLLIFNDKNTKPLINQLTDSKNFTPGDVIAILNQAEIRFELNDPHALEKLFHYAQQAEKQKLSDAVLTAWKAAINGSDNKNINDNSTPFFPG